MDNQQLATQPATNALVIQPGELSVDQVLAQVAKIQVLMEKCMSVNEHYGTIPGTGDRVTLLKPGAEKLCFMFRLDPEYDITERQAGDHLTILSRCTLWHITSGVRLGSGMGSCSTRESKYAYRKGERACPKCGKESIIKGKSDYGGGWLCWGKKGGCNAKFKDGDQAIEGQDTERRDNPDLADQYNTVLKMANKRSLVAAVLNVTAASDIFTQDLEDIANARQTVADPDDDDVKRTGQQHPQAAKLDDELDNRRPDPQAKATAEHRKGLMGAATRKLGKEQATIWLRAEMDKLSVDKAADLTFGDCQTLIARLISASVEGESQERIAPDHDPFVTGDDPALDGLIHGG